MKESLLQLRRIRNISVKIAIDTNQRQLKQQTNDVTTEAETKHAVYRDYNDRQSLEIALIVTDLFP